MRTPTSLGILSIIAIAWAALVGWSLTPASVYLDHDELSVVPSLGGLLPLIGIFVAGWSLMIAASMLPPLARFAAAFVTATRRTSGGSATLLVLGYVGPWLAIGAGYFLLDFGIHHLIAASSFVASHQQYIWPLTLLAVASYELSPQKAHFVEHCCSSLVFLRRHWRTTRLGAKSFEVGLAQGFDSIAAMWALMLLMFAAGFTGIGWLVVVTLIAVAEAIAALRQSVRWASGIAIATSGAGALLATASASAPAWLLAATSPEAGYWLLAAAAVLGIAWGASSQLLADRVGSDSSRPRWEYAGTR